MQTIRRVILTVTAVFIAFALQAQVPDTDDFSLQDVIDEVSPSSNDLITSFDESYEEGFNSNYVPSGFDPQDNSDGYTLYYYRDYEHVGIYVYPNNIGFPRLSDCDRVEVGSSTFNYSVANVSEPWITWNYIDNQTLEICVQENTTGSERTGFVEVRNEDGYTDILDITQDS